MGGCDDDAVFYYRIHSPVILIEFDHQTGVAFDNDQPTRNHIHTVVRTPNGNDYGKDLLRQHYARHPHPVAARGWHQTPRCGARSAGPYHAFSRRQRTGARCFSDTYLAYFAPPLAIGTARR